MNPYVQYMYSYPHKTAYRPLQGVSLKEYASLLAGGGHGLYLHIPFCQAKCGYCNLFSVTGQGKEAVDRYLDAVERQAGQYADLLGEQHCKFSDLVIGGGTPLLLTEEQLERVFRLLEGHFAFDPGREMVIETAPNQTTREKLAIIKQAGVTRVSMGIQSFLDEELLVLRRRHNGETAREALDLLKSFDFPCVNVDFIYGIPGQTKESLLMSLKEALTFAPEEIFLYPLYVKRGVGLAREGVVPDPVAAYGQYLAASQYLLGEGFRQDSMRRFVRRGNCAEQEDNVRQGNYAGKEAGVRQGNYAGKETGVRQGNCAGQRREFSDCGFGTSIALGCGGRSYLGKLHFCTPYAVDREACLGRLKEYEDTWDYTQITHGILLSEEELKRRYVIRHLLIRPGIDLHSYQEHFKEDVMEEFPLLRDWQEQELVEVQRHGQEEFLVLTEQGLGLSDYLGPKLISPQMQKAMEEWKP